MVGFLFLPVSKKIYEWYPEKSPQNVRTMRRVFLLGKAAIMTGIQKRKTDEAGNSGIQNCSINGQKEITQITGEIEYKSSPAPTNTELQEDYNYEFAENLTKKLFEKGLISDDEYDKITAKNRRTFSTFMAKLYL